LQLAAAFVFRISLHSAASAQCLFKYLNLIIVLSFRAGVQWDFYINTIQPAERVNEREHQRRLRGNFHWLQFCGFWLFQNYIQIYKSITTGFFH